MCSRGLENWTEQSSFEQCPSLSSRGSAHLEVWKSRKVTYMRGQLNRVMVINRVGLGSLERGISIRHTKKREVDAFSARSYYDSCFTRNFWGLCADHWDREGSGWQRETNWLRTTTTVQWLPRNIFFFFGGKEEFIKMSKFSNVFFLNCGLGFQLYFNITGLLWSSVIEHYLESFLCQIFLGNIKIFSSL